MSSTWSRKNRCTALPVIAGLMLLGGRPASLLAQEPPPELIAYPDLVVVNGKVLMKDRQVRTLDRATVIADATRFSERVRAAVPVP